MTRIDAYLKAALNFWKEKLTEIQAKHPQKTLPKQYKGYVASFGTAVIHCGLLPAVFMFSRGSENAQTDEDKTWVIDGVLKILKNEDTRITADNLLDYVLATGETPALTRRICDAAVALKLALRTFKLD